MLGTLIKSQVLENLYGIKFVITFIVCTVLVIGTTFSGIGRYESQLNEEKQVTTTNRGSLEEAGNWRSVSREGIKIVKSASRLGIFSSGLEESVGRTATVQEGDFPHMEDSIYSTAPIFAVFGDLDLTFIIKIVISLFAILFTYDLVSGEKERGTLKLCLSNSVPRNTFLLGKSIGSFISLLLPLFIPLLIALLLIMTIGGIDLSGEEWIRLAILIFAYMLYMLAFFSLGLFVSTMTRHSAVSFLVLLFVWVLFVLVIPRGSMMLANQIDPIPGINEVRAEQYQLRRDYWEATWQKTREEFERVGGVNLPDSQRWMRMREIRNQIREELEPEYLAQNEKLVDDFKRQQNNLTTLAMNLSRISPASAITFIGMNLSGTGFQDQENFLTQLAVYRGNFTQFVESEIEKETQRAIASRGMMMHGAEEQGKLDINRIPRFDYRKMTLSESMELILPDIASLTILSIIFYLLAFILFIRYDVR